MMARGEISLVYIDDTLDEEISCYLKDHYRNGEVTVKYQEVMFRCGEGYESLLESEEVNRANVILIDSRLFENDNVRHEGKFSGEEFRMILKKMFPFIEVLVISQNGENPEYGIIPKYRSTGLQEAMAYYDRVLKSKIDDSICKVITFRNISEKLADNKGIEAVLVQRIVDSLNGISDYEELKKEDIDSLIAAFSQFDQEQIR